MTLHRSTNLIALSCTDLRIRIIDTETRKLVRELSLHPKSQSSKRKQQQQSLTVQDDHPIRITDHCFSKDGRWIIASSNDCVIRVWDLPTGHMIDAFRLPSPCQALAFSNTGEFLATALEDSVGVHIWTNRTMFTHVPTRPIDASEIAEIEAPTASGEGGQTVIGAALDGDENEATQDAQDMEAPPASVDQLSADITTLSLVPKTRWQTLANLELIRERNKPVEAPKAPEKAPFFLPSMSLLGPGKDDAAAAGYKADHTSSAILGMRHEVDDAGGDELAPTTPGQESRIMKNADASAKAQTRFTTLLRECAASYATESSNKPASANDPSYQTPTTHYQPFTTYLSTLNPSSADIAIRSLDPAPPFDELIAFLEALIELLRRRTDFELGQAWMKVFLRVWGGVLGEVIEDERASKTVKEVGEDVTMEDLVSGVISGGISGDGDGDGDGDENGRAKLIGTLKMWREEQGREMERLDGLFGFCLGVVGFLRGS